MLSLEKVSLAYGDAPVVLDTSFSLQPGEIGALLGPSGCGKSTLLRGIAGFETPTAGSISWNGKTLSNSSSVVAPEHRRIGMVFQNFALFPHLSIAANIAFGLRDLSKDQRLKRVSELMELFGLGGMARRAPHSLSGGEQQRVALARALAPKPNLLLMDEAFSNLDVELRLTLLPEVREILKQENICALLVTHDQHEAFAMADKMGVMNHGRINQWDDPYAIYHRPETRFVAEFVGEGIMLKATANDSGNVLSPLGTFSLPKDQRLAPGSQVDILIRPDDVLHDDKSEFKGEITRIVFRGSYYQYRVRVDSGVELYCFADSHHKHELGEQIGLVLMLEHLVIFDQNRSVIIDQDLAHPQNDGAVHPQNSSQARFRSVRKHRS